MQWAFQQTLRLQQVQKCSQKKYRIYRYVSTNIGFGYISRGKRCKNKSRNKNDNMSSCVTHRLFSIVNDGCNTLQGATFLVRIHRFHLRRMKCVFGGTYPGSTSNGKPPRCRDVLRQCVLDSHAWPHQDLLWRRPI